MSTNVPVGGYYSMPITYGGWSNGVPNPDVLYYGFENKVLVSGLSSATSPSTVRELNFPFADSDKGIGVEIYHAAHGKSEDYAAMRTFVPIMIDGEPSILAAYVCTPLVKIPLKELEASGEKVKGTTVAELGNMNRPLDMIAYQKEGADYLLLSNSARGVMKITTAGLKENKGLTEPGKGGGTAGQTFEAVASMVGSLPFQLKLSWKNRTWT